MAVVGAPASVEEPERVMAEFALEALAAFQSQFSRTMSLRIGLHSGPLVAGIIGEKRFSYDLWGSTVNIASRLETHGMPGKIHVSDQFKDRCNQGFTFVPRGFLELKGVGKMETFFLEP